MTDNHLPEEAFARLDAVMAALRDPDRGCPWDRKQTHRSLIPYLLEEAHEVIDAIERDDEAELCEELGDLLFQVVFHAQLAREREAFALHDVATAVADKLVRRHPHVFGDVTYADEDAFRKAWDQHKRSEKQARRGADPGSVLADALRSAPALMQAQDIQKRVAKVGFDWTEVGGVFDKVREELAELAAAHAQAEGPQRLREEIGDLLFSVVNLARHLGVDAEDALRGANRKFTQRFEQVEQAARASGRQPAECTTAELEAFWQQAKASVSG